MKIKNLSLKNVIISVIILFSCIFYAYYGLYKMLFVNIETLGFDFKICYYTAQKYLNGIPIYHDPIGIYPYLYPPVTLMVFLPFSILEQTVAVETWFLICNALFVLSAFIIYNFGKKEDKYHSAAATMMAFLFSMPLYSTIFLGNLNIVIFFGLCLIYHFVIIRKMTIVPWIIAAYTYIKLFPAVLIMIFFRRSNFRLIRIFAFALLVMSVISIIAFGFEEQINFLLNIKEGYRWVGPLQMSSVSYFVKLYLPVNHKINIIINILFGCLLLALWWNQSRKMENFNISALIVDLFLLTVIMILLFPSSSIIYGIFLIVPFYFVILSWLQNQNQFKHFWFFILLFLLINLWEIIANHIPLTIEQFSLVELRLRKDQFPIIYPLVHSLPFVFMTLFYWWLLVNYKKLDQAIRSLIR